MNTFYFSSALVQSALMTAMFLSLLLSLFLMFYNYDRKRKRAVRYLNIAIFLLLFVILAMLADTSMRIDENLPIRILLPIPVWVFWVITCVCDIYLICEIIRQYRQKDKNLTRNSVKQAMDTLPSAICYFSPSGAVKLCNLQMYCLFRSLAQSDLQSLEELQRALADCDDKSGIIKLSDVRQTYLFPDGKVWRYSQTEVSIKAGSTYTESIFSDVTEQYEKHLELKRQTEQLKKISYSLKQLSDNVLTLTKERETLTAKTRLHDQMGGGILAIRQILQQNHTTEENVAAVSLLSKAVNIIKNDNEYPAESGELADFIHDAETIGIQVEIVGTLPEQREVFDVFMIALRECLTNSARHANAAQLKIVVQEDENTFSVRITNNGKPPQGEVKPKGGLINLYRHVNDSDGTMKIQSQPNFALTVTIPKKEEFI